VTTDLELTLALLRQVLPDRRWDDDAFLEWVYQHNPAGPAVEVNIDRADKRVSHIGGLPTPLRSSELTGTAVLLVNLASSPEIQMGGGYRRGIRRLDDAARAAGHLGLFGVTNARSTRPVLRGVGASWQCSLPVRVCVPWWIPRQVSSREVTPSWLESNEFVHTASRLDRSPARDLTQRWTRERLRWRLGVPGMHYAVHWDTRLVSVTTRTEYRGVPVAVILKLLPRDGHTGPLSPRAHISAACRHHRTPVALYAGFNRHVPVEGIRLAQDRLPSPLNLVMLSSQPDVLPQHRFVFDTFEFLDFDAF